MRKLIIAFTLFASAALAAPTAIILERANPPSDLSYRVVLWADVPVQRQPFYASAGKVSAYKNASGAENTALANGSVAEKEIVLYFPAGTPLATMQARVQAELTAWQSEVTNINPWLRYGTRFVQGSGWTPAGVN